MRRVPITVAVVSLLLLFVGNTTSSAQAADSPPYKIGIFPAAGDFGLENRSTQEEGSADILRAMIGANEGLVLSYSHYHEHLSAPKIRGSGRVWTGAGIRKKPKLNEVSRLARERDLDAVVMAWGEPAFVGVGSGVEDPQNPVFIYMIDVERSKVDHRKGTFADVRRMSQQVFADFLKNRPKVVQAKAAPAAAALVPKVSPIATRSTPYKIAIFPFENDRGNSGRKTWISDDVTNFIRSDSSFTLVYSFYSDEYSRDRIPKTDKLWVGGAVRKKPNLALLYATARKLGVDGIVMAFHEGWSSASPDPAWWTLELYLIGVDRQQVHYRKGRMRDTRTLIRGVFADFVKSRPQVVASVKQPGVPPPSRPIGAQAGDWTINYCKDLTVAEFHKAARWAFNNRKFVIEKVTPSSLTGARKGKKVEVAMTAPGQIVIRWVPGFGYEKDNWLKNLRWDVSVALAL